MALIQLKSDKMHVGTDRATVNYNIHHTLLLIGLVSGVYGLSVFYSRYFFVITVCAKISNIIYIINAHLAYESLTCRVRVIIELCINGYMYQLPLIGFRDYNLDSFSPQLAEFNIRTQLPQV